MKDTKAWAVVSDEGDAELASHEGAEGVWTDYLSSWPENRRDDARTHLAQFGYTTQPVVIVSAERYAELIAHEAGKQAEQ